jgi:hypothetical protein
MTSDIAPDSSIQSEYEYLDWLHVSYWSSHEQLIALLNSPRHTEVSISM